MNPKELPDSLLVEMTIRMGNFEFKGGIIFENSEYVKDLLHVYEAWMTRETARINMGLSESDLTENEFMAVVVIKGFEALAKEMLNENISWHQIGQELPV